VIFFIPAGDAVICMVRTRVTENITLADSTDVGAMS
jgi:hypothetical protein